MTEKSTALNKLLVQTDEVAKDLAKLKALEGLSRNEVQLIHGMKTRVHHVQRMARTVLKALSQPEWTSDRKDRYRKDCLKNGRKDL